MTSTRTPAENSDTVNLIIALLVRFPEIATIRAAPAERAVRLSFAVRERLERAAQDAVMDAIADHIEALLDLTAGGDRTVGVECEIERALTFIHVTRDTDSFGKDELLMLTDLLSERFGERLVRTPPGEENLDEDPAAQEELVDYAIDCIRDPSLQKNLVGYREGKRVLVYFLQARKKAKGASRS